MEFQVIDKCELGPTFFDDKGGWIVGPPNTSGVYGIYITRLSEKSNKLTTNRIIYIGSSCNLSQRILANTHPYRLLYNRLSLDFNITLRICTCINYCEVEKELIRIYKPLLNKNGKR